MGVSLSVIMYIVYESQWQIMKIHDKIEIEIYIRIAGGMEWRI